MVQWSTEGGQLEETMTEVLRVRITPTLKKQIEQQAETDRRTLADWIRITLEDASTPLLAATPTDRARVEQAQAQGG